MKDYFDEAIKDNEKLEIFTKNEKKMIVNVQGYNEEELYYSFKIEDKPSRIFLKNIKKVKFLNQEKERQLKKKRLSLPDHIEKYFDYYRKCLEELNKDGKGNLKIDLYNKMFDSVFDQDSSNLLVQFFKGEKQEENPNSKNKPCLLLSESNASQREAIHNAINNKISIIQGPPGTGKTTTILSLIANLIMNGEKVVVVSKNNSAVNNIIEEYAKTNLPEFYLRFGRKEIMDELLDGISNKMKKINASLAKIVIEEEDLVKLEELRNELEILESKIDELISLKNLVEELKIQKRFIDKRNNLYNFKHYITKEEAKIICDKYATPKNINKLIALSYKEKYSFFTKLILKYKYCLRIDDIKRKLLAIINLLEEFYINKEIADKEELLLKENLEGKQKRVKEIYTIYKDLCMKSFKAYLKNNLHVANKTVHNQKELIELAFHVFPLVLTTADGFLFNFKEILKLNKQVDCVIIDEASQCDVITGLPLLFLAKRIVVVGDSKQLGAITNVEIKDSIPKDYKYDQNSFLEAIKNIFSPLEKTLEEHYRCNYNIINFCNKYYYHNQLKIYTPSDNHAMEFMNVDGYKGADKIDKDIINKREVKAIKDCVNVKEDFFTITPFAGQAVQLEKLYGEERAGTIHRFQGKGAKTVYFSTVLNDLPFCNQHIRGKCNMFYSELVNVAVSRAKDKFILVTDKNYFLKNGKYVSDVKNLIDYIGIYGKEISDKSSCIFDYLYKQTAYYHSNKIFDNIYEEKLAGCLSKIIEGSPYICYPKLKMSNLVLDEEFLNQNMDIKTYIGNGAHADFTIIDKRINKPVLVIELDGKYHKEERQKKNDLMKDKALTAVHITMLRIDSKEAYDLKELKEKLGEYIELD